MSFGRGLARAEMFLAGRMRGPVGDIGSLCRAWLLGGTTVPLPPPLATLLQHTAPGLDAHTHSLHIHTHINTGFYAFGDVFFFIFTNTNIIKVRGIQ